jgi:broad specificity phosphatase PhoE
LQRARATASAVPERLEGHVRLLRSLAEIDCGSVEGLRIDEIRTIYPDLWQQNEAQNDDEFRWPGGETYRRFRQRVLRAIRGIARKHAGERVLLFTHAGVITQILGSLTGQCSAVWATPRVQNASLTEIAWSETGGRILRCDDTSHLH